MDLFKTFEDSLPMISAFIVGALVLLMIQWIYVATRKNGPRESNFRRHWFRLLLTLIVLALLLILVFSIEPDSRQTVTVLAGVLGIVLSAAISISSTTFISNSMAGLMLRALGNFKVGDYVRVGDQFGRVSERGIFHVEIQTEDSDLSTIPNLYFVSQPVIVVRASKTIVSVQVSLGYDVSHVKVEAVLKQAALDAGMKDPFVYLLSLGDFSINYRIAAVLHDVEHLLSSRSRLRTCVLDGLHSADIEVVSPNYVNQRRVGDESVIADPVWQRPTPDTSAGETIMFDEVFAAEREELTLSIAELESELEKADEENGTRIRDELKQKRERLAEINRRIGESTEQKD